MRQEMLERHPQMSKIRRMVGGWEVDVTIDGPDGEHTTGKGRFIATGILRGNGIRGEMHVDVGGEPYELHDLWSFDLGEGKMHIMSVTTDGEAHDHVGEWRDDRTLVLRWEGTRDGKEAHEDMVITFASGNDIIARAEDFVDGRRSSVFEFRMRR